jgi:hypothetical protein
MDLHTTEQVNGRHWMLAKQGAFMCFLVACALLGASLFFWQPDDISKGGQAHVARSGPLPR